MRANRAGKRVRCIIRACKPSQRLTEHVLGAGGTDDNLSPHRRDANLDARVAVLCQLPCEKLVELGVEDAIGDELRARSKHAFRVAGCSVNLLCRAYPEPQRKPQLSGRIRCRASAVPAPPMQLLTFLFLLMFVAMLGNRRLLCLAELAASGALAQQVLAAKLHKQWVHVERDLQIAAPSETCFCSRAWGR